MLSFGWYEEENPTLKNFLPRLVLAANFASLIAMTPIGYLVRDSENGCYQSLDRENTFHPIIHRLENSRLPSVAYVARPMPPNRNEEAK